MILCPGCDREKSGNAFIAGLCRRCYSNGVDFPGAGEGEKP